ncbi:MAG: hypothetical protein OXC55_06440 [Chloroflexi bacterium]|nr:hypothetical protein [Chloroflexota bacterium]
MFKGARPTDLAGLLGLASRATIDHAYPYTRVGHEMEVERSVARIVGAASLPRKGETLAVVLKNDDGLGGLAFVRGAKDSSSWEIEHLLIPPDNGDLCAELLPQLSRQLRPKKGTNVFLRLSDDSPIVDSVGSAGFRGYAEEELYVRPAGDRAERGMPEGVSVWELTEPADFRLFRLHTSCSPVEMRAADGMTLREWQESLATRWIDVRKTTDIVASTNGVEQIGWVRFGQVGSNAVIARCAASSEQPEAIEALIESVIQSSGRSRTIQFLTPSYDGATARALLSRGFRSEATYRSFSYQMGQRVLEGAFAPAGL